MRFNSLSQIDEAWERPDVSSDKSIENEPSRLSFEQVHKHVLRLDNQVIKIKVDKIVWGFGTSEFKRRAFKM